MLLLSIGLLACKEDGLIDNDSDNTNQNDDNQNETNKIEEYLASMSIRDKVSQMLMMS